MIHLREKKSWENCRYLLVYNYDFQTKLGGHLRTLCLLAASIYAASKTEFAKNSLKSPKIGKLNIDTLIIPQGLLIHEKTRPKISCYCPFNYYIYHYQPHDTVPWCQLIKSWCDCKYISWGPVQCAFTQLCAFPLKKHLTFLCSLTTLSHAASIIER